MEDSGLAHSLQELALMEMEDSEARISLPEDPVREDSEATLILDSVALMEIRTLDSVPTPIPTLYSVVTLTPTLDLAGQMGILTLDSDPTLIPTLDSVETLTPTLDLVDPMEIPTLDSVVITETPIPGSVETPMVTPTLDSVLTLLEWEDLEEMEMELLDSAEATVVLSGRMVASEDSRNVLKFP